MSRLYYTHRPRSPSPLCNCIASQSKPYEPEPDLDVPKDRLEKKCPEREIDNFDLRKAVLINESCRFNVRPPKPEDQVKTGRKRKFGEIREDDVAEICVPEQPKLARKRVYTGESRRARKRECTDVKFYLRPLCPSTFFQ